MSLIIAIKKDGVVYLGADTRTTIGDRIYPTLTPDNLKIKRVGSCFIGSAGVVSSIQLMTEHPEWFELNGEPLTKRFIVQNIIPKYYDLAKNANKLETDEKYGNSPKSECAFIVTDGKRIFEIDDDFEVCEQSEYAVIGCVNHMMQYVLRDLPSDSVPRETILKLLRMASHRHSGVGAPYVLIDTKENKLEMVEE